MSEQNPDQLSRHLEVVTELPKDEFPALVLRALVEISERLGHLEDVLHQYEPLLAEASRRLGGPRFGRRKEQ